MAEYNQARREGQVKFGYDFSDLAEVTHLWGLTASRLPYHNSFKIPGRENALCLLLSENGGKGWRNVPHRGSKTDGRGWREIVRIDEFNADPEVSARRVEEELARPLERYVFWRESRDGVMWYKFYGVFSLDVADTQRAREDGQNVCIYRKVSDVGVCPKCEVEVKSITEEEFRSYEGKMLLANLIDHVPFEVSDKEHHSGEIKVWPGQRFRVMKVSASGLSAECEPVESEVRAQVKYEGEVRFVVPKRDIELGYFGMSSV